MKAQYLKRGARGAYLPRVAHVSLLWSPVVQRRIIWKKKRFFPPRVFAHRFHHHSEHAWTEPEKEHSADLSDMISGLVSMPKACRVCRAVSAPGGQSSMTGPAKTSEIRDLTGEPHIGRPRGQPQRGVD